MNDLRHRRKKQNFRIDSSIAHLSKQINIEEEEEKKSCRTSRINTHFYSN
jgi:hypothetical protein